MSKKSIASFYTFRLLSCLWFVAWALTLTGCATLPKNFDRPVSVSLPEPHINELGRHIENDAMAHPGMSGFYVLNSNIEALVARGMLAQVSEKTLDLQYYIFKGDESGALVLSWVLEAAERGVRVRILLDDLGQAAKDSQLVLLSSHPNISVRVFNPFAQRSGLKTDFLFDLGRVERRMHNKSFIADNSAAIIGGRNIGNEYFTVPGARTFLDLDVLTVGPVVKDISTSFDAFWNSEWAYPVEVLHKKSPTPEQFNEAQEWVKEKREGLINSPYREAVINSNLYQNATKREFNFLWASNNYYYDRPEKIGVRKGDKVKLLSTDLRSLFKNVKSEFVIVTPYFVPTESGVEFFTKLRERGVQVKVATNSLATNDVWVVHSGYAPYRKDLLSQGVQLYEMKSSAFHKYREAFRKYVEVDEVRLHIKAIVLDRRYVIMGSSNFDPRAFDYNTEIGLVIDSPELADQMLGGFDKLIAPENGFRLFLVDEQDDSGRVRQKVRWETVEDGETVIYKDEPGAGFWRKFGAWFVRVFPIEGKL